MKSGFSLFLLLIAISAMAFSLAFLVRERNLALHEYSPELTAQIEKAKKPRDIIATVNSGQFSTTTHIVESSPSDATTTVIVVRPATPIFYSDDQVAQASLEGYPMLSSPFIFNGTGTAFESRMSWRLRDAKRNLLGEGSFNVMSPDAGIPGPFHVEGVWDIVPKTATGTLFIFEASAKDGTPIHIVTIPVTFVTTTTPIT